LVAPLGNVQGSPEQQSADVVQELPVMTQAPPHTNPDSLVADCTQGRPQQSALDAHDIPILVAGSVQTMPVPTPQRGMPRLSL